MVDSVALTWTNRAPLALAFARFTLFWCDETSYPFGRLADAAGASAGRSRRARARPRRLRSLRRRRDTGVRSRAVLPRMRRCARERRDATGRSLNAGQPPAKVIPATGVGGYAPLRRVAFRPKAPRLTRALEDS